MLNVRQWLIADDVVEWQNRFHGVFMIRYSYFLILFWWLSAPVAYAQLCPEPKYDCFLLNGRKFFDAHKLDEARGYFLAAADCDDAPKDPREIEYWIDEVEKRLPKYRIEQRARTLALLSDKVDPTQAMRLLSMSYVLDSTIDSTRLRIIQRYTNSIERPFYCAVYEHPHAIRHIALSPDGSRFVTTTLGAAYLWRVENMEKPIAVLHHRKDKMVWTANFSADGTRIVTAADDSTVKIWDVTGDQIRLFKYGSELKSAVFSPKGTHVLAVSTKNAAVVWDLAQSGSKPIELKHLASVQYAAYSADGYRILTTSLDKTAVIWSVSNNFSRLATLRHETPITGGAISPDATKVVTFSDNGEAFLWNGGIKMQSLSHRKMLLYATFSHDGSKLVTTSADFTAKVWDMKKVSPLPMATLLHNNAILFAAFSPDDSRVLTASSDKTAKVWDLQTPDKPFAVFYHEDIVQMGGFSRDGERVITCSDDRLAKLWDIYQSSPIRLFWSAKGGSLFAPPENLPAPPPGYIVDWLQDAPIAPFNKELKAKYGLREKQ